MTGVVLFDLGDRKQGLNTIDEGVKLADDIRNRSDAKLFDDWDWHVLALVYNWAGIYLERNNNQPEAIERYGEAFKMDSRGSEAADAQHRVAAWRYVMGHTAQIGDLQLKLHHNELAKVAYNNGVNIAAYIAEKENSLQSRRDLWARYFDRGESEFALAQDARDRQNTKIFAGELEASLKDYSECQKIAKAMPVMFRTIATRSSLVGNALGTFT